MSVTRETDADAFERMSAALRQPQGGAACDQHATVSLTGPQVAALSRALSKAEYALDQLCAAAGKIPRHLRPDTRDALRDVRGVKRFLPNTGVCP